MTKLYCCNEYIKQFNYPIGHPYSSDVIISGIEKHVEEVIITPDVYIYGYWMYGITNRITKGTCTTTNSIAMRSKKNIRIFSVLRGRIRFRGYLSHPRLFVETTIPDFYYAIIAI